MPATRRSTSILFQIIRARRERRSAAKIDSAMKGHIIAEATLMGRYAKKGSKR